MGEVVNLRLARKRKESHAMEARARFGRGRADNPYQQSQAALDGARLEGQRRDHGHAS